jgi:hypothetical protein
MNEVDEIRERMESLGNDIADVCLKHDTPPEMDFAVLLKLAVNIALHDGVDADGFLKACYLTYTAMTEHPDEKELH